MSLPAHPKRILLVEDDEPLLGLLQENLVRAGYEVTACSDGCSALSALAGSTYDAVLSDIRMPGLQGLELLSAIQEQELDLPVVLLTGRPSMESAVKAIEYGAVSYLIKPVSNVKLLETVDRAVKLGTLARLKREALSAIGFDRNPGEHGALDTTMTRALDALWMAYQPIVSCADGAIYAHEALVRSDAPEFPNAGALIGAAERLGRIPELGEAIRGQVSAALESGALQGPVFLNLHPSDLGDDSLFDPRAPLSRHAHRVVLEITERARLDGIPDVPDRITALRDLGFRIAIDDLGAGYAGLSSLATLAPEIVKIDMALVRDMDLHQLKRKLFASIVSVCRDLRILVVAEGVEREGEREAVRSAGCELAQGFLFGGPVALGTSRTRSAAL